MDVGVRARVVAGKVATGPSSSTSLAFIVGKPFAFAFPRLLLFLSARVVLVVFSIGSRVVGRAPPVIIVRVSKSSFPSFVFSFAFNIAFILASFTFRGIGLVTFALFSI